MFSFFAMFNVMKIIGAFIVYSMSFNLADFNWPEEQSTSIKYLCLKLVHEDTCIALLY